MTGAEQKPELSAPDEWHSDERTDFERCESFRIGARIIFSIADDENFSGAGCLLKFVREEIPDAINADDARRVFPMPNVCDHRFTYRLVDFDKGAERKTKRRADLRANDPHHFVNACQTSEVLADLSEKREIHFRTLTLGDVIDEGEEAFDLSSLICVRDIVDAYISHPSGFVRSQPVEGDFLTRQSCIHLRADGLVGCLTQYIYNPPTDDLLWHAIKPSQIGSVGKTISPFGVHIRDQRRRRVSDEAELSLAAAQCRCGAFALGNVGNRAERVWARVDFNQR